MSILDLMIKRVWLFIFLCIAFGVTLAWAWEWLSVPGHVTSAEQVQNQWAFAYEYEEALQAAAQQVCSAERGVQQASNETEATQRRSHVLAYEQNYARIEAAYNARLRNPFQGKYVKPKNVPEKAPSLAQMKQKVCIL